MEHNKIFDTRMMSEEERKNPNLLKESEEFKQTPVSIYYGSPKKELVDTCLTCKKILDCEEHYMVREQSIQLRDSLKTKDKTRNLSEQEIEKLKNNVYIVVHCIYKERD